MYKLKKYQRSLISKETSQYKHNIAPPPPKKKNKKKKPKQIIKKKTKKKTKKKNKTKNPLKTSAIVTQLSSVSFCIAFLSFTCTILIRP